MMGRDRREYETRRVAHCAVSLSGLSEKHDRTPRLAHRREADRSAGVGLRCLVLSGLMTICPGGAERPDGLPISGQVDMAQLGVNLVLGTRG
jgi:hypothetical protein